MKVGVDGVLIGCWTDVQATRKILDVGTGCGLIALIMAQRAPKAKVQAIDIDEPSVEEAIENVKESPWSERIEVKKVDFSDLLQKSSEKYDLIISNPPYFDSGVTEINTAREIARHQGHLSPSAILLGSGKILNKGGSVAMVVPTEISDELEEKAATMGYSLWRKCLVRGHAEASFKRVLLQWRLHDDINRETDISSLTLEISPTNPTNEYRALCKDFYMKF